MLDMDLGFLKGIRVCLVDDVIVSGTTLREAHDKLVQAGAEVVTDVIAVDQDWWSEDLIRPREPYVALKNQASMALCGQIVHAISLIPRPYNVDWPMTTLRLANRLRPRLHDVSGFAAADVTSSLQGRHGISVYTCEPASWVADQIDDSFGWPTTHLALH
jgi:hypothetical protein